MSDADRLEHTSASALTPGWIGSRVAVAVPGIGVVSGVLADYDLREGHVVLYIDGDTSAISPITTVSRGDLDLLGRN